MTNNADKVLIIGGGLGGLAFAQGLRKHGLKFEIYERDKDAGARAQGWVLSLHWILKSLYANTPDDMPPFDTVSIGYETGLDAEFAYYDAITGKEQARFSHSKEKPLLRSDRGRVRRWLMHNLDIQWNKQFTHYEETEQGVKAYFSDGSSAEGTVIVGADGVNSTVRRQLMANSDLKPRAILLGNITGIVDLDESQIQRQLELARSFYLAHSPNHRLFVGMRSIAKDRKSASYYWRLSWFDQAAEKEPFWTVNASQEKLLEYARQNTQDFNPTMTEALRATSPSGIVSPSLVFWDMEPVPLPWGRVTLLGDSIHPMSPFRGEGGNYAIADGLNLAGCLSRHAGGEVSLSPKQQPVLVAEILKEYEQEMLIQGTQGVLKSRDAAEDHQKTVKQDVKVNGGNDKDSPAWLARRIVKQAGDQGFQRS